MVRGLAPCLAVVLAACGHHEQIQEKVTLVAAGEAPRRALVYAAPGQAARVRIETGTSVQGHPGLRTRLVVAYAPDGGTGDRRQAVRIEAAEPAEVPADMGADERRIFEGVFAAVRGHGGTLVTDARGRLRSLSTGGAAVRIDPYTFEELAAALVVPLPDEPVGLHARWEAKTPKGTRRFELAGIEGDVLRVRVDGEGREGDDERRVERRGRGELAIRLDRLAPVEGRLEESIRQTVRFALKDEPHETTAEITASIVVGSP